MTTYVSLRVGVSRCLLTLARHPKYLRFVMTGTDWNTLDALDQLDDEPREGEHVIAAVYASRGVMHVSGVRKGRRFGEWRATITYEPVADPPPQEVLRDAARWRDWVVARTKTPPLDPPADSEGGEQ